MGSKNRIFRVGLVLAIATLGALPLSAAAEEGDVSGCNNYGVIQQVSVTGDNHYTCMFQYCIPAGAAGALGAGVGVNGSNGEAGAQATAGTACTQTGPDPGSEPVRKPVLASLLDLESLISHAQFFR